jgi:hypothetical protein
VDCSGFAPIATNCFMVEAMYGSMKAFFASGNFSGVMRPL